MRHTPSLDGSALESDLANAERVARAGPDRERSGRDACSRQGNAMQCNAMQCNVLYCNVM